ncbi:hypothetical protein BH11PSE12_BH11PSE12_21480 [soil metagenome]
MVAAFAAGDFSLQEISKHFEVHYSTVSRALKMVFDIALQDLMPFFPSRYSRTLNATEPLPS